jgi:hypothetical protein
MPHQCTSCEELFSDGSKKMLAGCTTCGGKKFQFIPHGASPTPPETILPSHDIIEAPNEPPAPTTIINLNYTSQPSPPQPSPPQPSPPQPSPPQPSPNYIEQLHHELSSQFESIRILEPGQYELNLMELYTRDECIIAIQEDGRYVIQVPDYT